MGVDKPDLQSAQYETPARKDGEDLASYVLRSTRNRGKKYSYEDRIALARLQMELREEQMVSDAEIGAEALFYLETLIAAYDFHDTFRDEEYETDEFHEMIDRRRRLIKYIKSRLKRIGVIPKTVANSMEMIREAERMVVEIKPIRGITKRLQTAVKKILNGPEGVLPTPD